jgi:kynurenine formamidase
MRADHSLKPSRSGAPEVPDFDDLPTIEGLKLHHAWGVFGPEDQIGTVNFLTAARAKGAATEIQIGAHFSLTVNLDAIDPPLYGREPMNHSIFKADRNSLDDRLDAFYLQSCSHWDGLRHVRAREHGFWGGITDSDLLQPRSGQLGIEHWVEHGMVGRGVLLDVDGWLRLTNPEYDPFTKFSITASDLEATATHQGTNLQPGDVLCVRLGWIGRYLGLDASGRLASSQSMEFAGLAADEEMSRWLWNHRVAAIACDNPAVEVSPGDPTIGSLHRRLLPLLGMALGELFDFDALADASAADGRYSFFFVSVPLRLAGGVGSPANALAIR